jgi:primosomal replication protein N
LDSVNELALTGIIVERDALRHTPAGIALVNFRVAHASEQREAGTTRQVNAEVVCLAVEEQARLVVAAPLGAAVRLSGFLAAKGRTGKQLVLHVKRIEFE